MKDKKFEGILPLIVSQVVSLIVENHGQEEIEASKGFYGSEVYALLEDEDTKMWHFSPQTLFDMYAEEKATGKFEIPEGM